MNELKNHISAAKGLIKRGNLDQAHQLLCQILINDPFNKYVKKTINKIELSENFVEKKEKIKLESTINNIIKDYSNGNLQKVIEDLEKAYKEFPNSAMLNNLKGLTFRKQNNFLEAEKFFKKAYEIDPSLYETLNNLGNLYYQFGLLDKALETYTDLINNHPEYIYGLSNRSNTFMQKNMLDKALQDINLAIEKKPTESKFWYNKSNIYKKLNDNTSCLHCLNKSIELNPKNVQALNNKCSVLEETGQLEEAILLNNECLKIEFENPLFHYNKGAILSRLGKLNLAQESLKKAIELKPDHFEAKWNLANCQLLNGKFEEGLKNFESRRKLSFWENRNFYKPELQEISQVKGKKILVTSEQGLGDTIQFARFAEKLSFLGGDIYLEVQSPIKELFSKKPNFNIITKNDQFNEFDYYIPLMSTLKLFNVEDMKSCKPTEILLNNKEQKKWANFFNKNKFNIGIAWQGNATHQDDLRGGKYSRSFSLKNLSWLRNFENVNVYNLQKNFGYNQINEFGYLDFINDFGKNYDNGRFAFSDSIHVMKKLDLVITCDTSIAHLAGSLNVPVWTVLKFVPDWRWLLDQNSTHWYSSMKLYRQKQLGNWNDVFREVQDDLKFTLKKQTFDMA